MCNNNNNNKPMKDIKNKAYTSKLTSTHAGQELKHRLQR
jgi:hypothetical protein